MKDDVSRPSLKSSRYSNLVPINPPTFFDLYPNVDNLSYSTASKPNLIDLSELL